MESLLPLRQDWQCALRVVAHPDDMEFGAAAAVAAWTQQGKTVIYCMVTSGEAGIDITETFGAGILPLQVHRAYVEGLGWEHFDPATFLDGTSREAGARMGVTHATAFEVFSMGW